jgi:SAM-dependent methyltransferase
LTNDDLTPRCGDGLEAGVEPERITGGNVVDLAGLPDECFGFVLDSHCLHCIIGEDRAAFFKSAARVLVPGGYFPVETMCGPVKEGTLEGYDPGSRCVVINGIASRYLGLPDDILGEITGAGFRILEHRVTQEDDEHPDLTVEATKPA